MQVRRIYNRIVFDELEVKKVELPFRYTDDLDVSWCSHPNWYWTWSKYTLPKIDHPAVPRARTVAALDRIPDDLERYVLKPLFSFAGSGVNVDPTRADIDAIPAEQREGWLLQEKITYEPALIMPTGEGVKGEVRMMFLRAPGDAAPKLVLNLVRLARQAARRRSEPRSDLGRRERGHHPCRIVRAIRPQSVFTRRRERPEAREAEGGVLAYADRG